MRSETTSRLSEALVYASWLHAAQVRKGSSIPYLAHLLAVVSIVLDYGGNEDEAIAAVLHDAVEDQGGLPTLEEIRKRFGPVVANIVAGCSESTDNPKPPWRVRKEEYLGWIVRAPASVRLVSAADKLHNVRAVVKDFREIGDALWSRFRGGKAGTLWYYRSLVAAYRRAGSTPLVEELARVVRELESLVRAAEKLEPRAPLPDMQRRLDLALKQYHFEHPEEKRRMDELHAEIRLDESAPPVDCGRGESGPLEC